MDQETYTQLPLQMDPHTKAISIIPGQSVSRRVETELAMLNLMHRDLIATTGQMPSPWTPVNPKRTALITQFRNQGIAAFKRRQRAEAIKFFTLAIEAASKRPKFEPASLVCGEVATLYIDRAMVHMDMQNWPEAAIDAHASVCRKRADNSHGWVVRARCLLRMGRSKEAVEWLAEACAHMPNDATLQALTKAADAAFRKDMDVQAGAA